MVLTADNHEQGLEHMLLDTCRALEELCDRWELVVVDDSSVDQTPQILARWAVREPRVRALTQRPRQGLSRALARGVLAARFLMIATGDATGRINPRQLARLLPSLREAHMVAGVRDGADRGLPAWLSRRLLNQLLDRQVRDPHCPLKLFRRSFFELVRPTCDRRMIHMELFLRARRAGLQWVEVEVAQRSEAGIEPERHRFEDLFQLWRLSRRI